MIAHLNIRDVLQDSAHASQGNLAKDPIWQLKLADIKAICKQHNLPTSGRGKGVLIDRLSDALKENGDAEVDLLFVYPPLNDYELPGGMLQSGCFFFFHCLMCVNFFVHEFPWSTAQAPSDETQRQRSTNGRQ